jgi:hypothetical protein
MKIIKVAGSTRLSLTRSEWESIGSKAGWRKEAGETVKQRSRGTCVFPAESKSVKDNKDHFPINDLAHGSNALSRVEQYTSSPPWYTGSLESLKSRVRSAVYEKFPGLKSRKEEREG